jgi:hypothetical protein
MLCNDIIYLIGEEVNNIRRINKLKKIIPKYQNIIRDKQLINKFDSISIYYYCMELYNLSFILGKNKIVIQDYNNDYNKYQFCIIKEGNITIRDVIKKMSNITFYKNRYISSNHIFLEGFDKVENKNINIWSVYCGS